MFNLSKLPIEIIFIISNYLETEDLISLARLNKWYSFRLSNIISKRIESYVKKEGWRIHIDILAKYCPLENEINSRLPFSIELLLLSEYININPISLELEFNLCPIDEEGLDSMKSSNISDHSIVLYNPIKFNIDIVAYFTQISSNKRLQHVNQAGASIIHDKSIWETDKVGSTRMSEDDGFKLNYNLYRKNNLILFKDLIHSFQNNYKQQFKSIKFDFDNFNPIILSFNTLRVSPEWWLNQMKIPMFEQNHSFL